MAHHRIVWLHNGITLGENYGNHLQRVTRPCELWADDAEFELRPVAINEPNAVELAVAADLLVVVQLGQTPINGLVHHRRRLGRPTLFELNDDVGQVGDWIAEKGAVHSPLWRQQVLGAAAACDAVQFSSLGLRKRFASLHRHSHVLDPYVPVPAAMPHKPTGFVVAWAGSNTHLDDLLAIAPALADFLRSHPEAKFALMGDLGRLQPVLQQLPHEQLMPRQFGSYEDLQAFLAGVHVGIAPLQNTGFNRCRSDGKFAQYAAAGAYALLAESSVFAPHRHHAQLFDSPQEMARQLTELYNDRSALSSKAATAFNWVQQHRNPHATRALMRQQFRRLLGGRAPLPYTSPPCPGHATTLATLLKHAEQALGKRRHEDALSICYQALTLSPDCEAAHWLVLSSLSHLKRYQELLDWFEKRPYESAYVDHYAALAYAAASQICPERKPEFLQRIAAPGLRLRLAGGRPGAMAPHYRAILAHEPYDYFALFGLIGMLRAQSLDHAELPALYERADLVAPKVVQALKK